MNQAIKKSITAKILLLCIFSCKFPKTFDCKLILKNVNDKHLIVNVWKSENFNTAQLRTNLAALFNYSFIFSSLNLLIF